MHPDVNIRLCSKMVFIIVCCTLLDASELSAIDRDDLLFYASFDRDVKADLAKGRSDPLLKPKAQLTVKIVKGIRGKAVIPQAGIVYSAKENLNPVEGTISFWISPIDWYSGDGKNHPILSWWAANGSVIIYQYYPGNFGMLMKGRKKIGTRTCWIWYTFRKGIFSHVAFSWRPGEWALYVNGIKRKQVTDSFVPFEKIGKFRIDKANSILDELMIFNRALSEQDIKALYYRVKRGSGSTENQPDNPKTL